MSYSYKEILSISYKALDLIPDLKKFFIKSNTIDYIMSDIEDAIYFHAYAGQPVEKYLEEHKDFFGWDIFNWLTTEEFLSYCKERFPEIKWGSETIERIWVAEVGDS